MEQALKKFEFWEFQVARESYNWDRFLDGKIYKLTEGEDYKCKTPTFSTLARAAARKRRMSLKSSKVEGGIIFRRF